MGRIMPTDSEQRGGGLASDCDFGCGRGPRSQNSTNLAARPVEIDVYEAARLAALEERNTELKRRLAEQRREANALRAQLASKRKRPPGIDP